MFLVNFGQYIFYYESLSYNFLCLPKKNTPPPHANSGVDAPSASSAGAKRFQREEEDEEEEGGVYKPWLVQTTIIVPK